MLRKTLIAATISTSILWLAPNQSQPDSKASPGPTLRPEVDRLIHEQKYSAALDLIKKETEQAPPKSLTLEQVKLWVQAAHLQIALHGYETAVNDLRTRIDATRALKGQDNLLARFLMQLTYAEGLIAYEQSYSWEISQREKMDGGTTASPQLDLSTATREQIFAEAERSFQELWNQRDRLAQQAKGALPDFLHPNTYPAGVRDTLRDSYSYLYAGLLNNRRGWSPRQTNEIYSLNLKKLAGEWKAPEIEKSLTGATHPIEKLVAVLADLEVWHLAQHQSSAELEAYLERVRILHSAFDSQPDREWLRGRLEQRLAQFKSDAWYAMGMATLAELVRQEQSPKHDSLIRALKIAEAGAQAFPSSPGAKRCRDIIQEIRLPHYSLEAMRVDGPGRKSLEIEYKNLKKIYFRSYPFDIRAHVESTKDYSLHPERRELEELVSHPPFKEWSEELPETIDYETHRALFTPPTHTPGFYVIVASARPDFGQNQNALEGTQIFFSDLVLTSRQHLNSNVVEMETFSGATGDPVAGAEVRLYEADYQKGHQLVQSKKSDAGGVVRFELGVLEKLVQQWRGGKSYFALAENKGQLAMSSNPFYFYPSSASENTSLSSFVYTDRGLYRPNQKILWKAIAFSGSREKGHYQVAKDSTLTVRLKDANYQIVQSAEVTTDAFGAASGEFVIPQKKLLGRWTIEVTGGGMIKKNVIGSSMVRVEEYKRPTFEVAIHDPAQAQRLNQNAELEGDAKYYFGLPVSEGKLRWNVYRQAHLPWWCFFGLSRFWDFGRLQAEQKIASGASPISPDGKFKISFFPKVDERIGASLPEVQYSYRLDVEVTDEGGETRTAARSFPLGLVAVTAHIRVDQEFIRAKEQVTASIVRTHLNGSPLPGKGSWKLVSLKQPERALLPSEQPVLPEIKALKQGAFSTPDDEKSPRWSAQYSPELVMRGWNAGELVSQGTIEHPVDGNGKLPLPKLEAGAYRLEYETQDAFGAVFKTRKEFLVSAKDSVFRLPADLALENSSVKVGEVARVLAFSGIPGQKMIFEVFRSGKRLERRVLVSGKDPSILEFPIQEKDRGGLGFTLRLIHDHEAIQLSKALFVPWDNQELKLEFLTLRERLTPGTTEKWKLRVLGPNGQKLSQATAQILAYMYDRSLDQLAPYSPFDPLTLYPNRTQSSFPSTELGAAPGAYFPSNGFRFSSEFSGFSPDNLNFYPRYGIGGPGQRGFGGGGFGREDFEGMSLGGLKKNAAPARARVEEMADSMSAFQDKKEEAQKNRAEAGAGTAEQQSSGIRSQFAETAFWLPRLTNQADGTAEIEFTVPDSVTSWNVWVHALTRDLQAGHLRKEVQTVKELMVRPYLPRFLREGDFAELKVMVNNAADHELKGTVDFEILDENSQKSLVSDFGLEAAKAKGLPFSVAAAQSASLVFPIKVPARLGGVIFKVTARSGNFSDGELRPIPVLPGRFHLAQSRFVTLRKAGDRQIDFEDLKKNSDPTRINDQLVVTLDAQLFYSVLSAVPYLWSSPYDCSEQVFNRFFSAGILTSVYGSDPRIAKMAAEMSKRKTRLETWDEPDPNRKMALEETPWLNEARGGGSSTNEDLELLNVLDPKKAEAIRNESLKKLEKAQTALGGFPWFPGGPPSPYMTAYLLGGFSKAREFGVEVPKPMLRRAWEYMHRHYIEEIVTHAFAHDCCWEEVTLLNFVLSNTTDPESGHTIFTAEERQKMLDFSFRHWKEHSPYLKGLLALTLSRATRVADAKLVWESVMDSARVSPDEGTYWMKGMEEGKTWLWYNDTVETHAFALRTGSELGTDPVKLDGLVQWIFLNKKLNHWKSTRATAEVLYSLTHYLKKTGQLGVREDAKVDLGGQSHSFEFLPDRYTGKKNQVTIPGAKVGAELLPIRVSKTTPGTLFASATWHFSTEQMPSEGNGDFLKIQRSYYRRVKSGEEVVLQPISGPVVLHVGDEVEVQVAIRSKHPMEYVHLKDPRPAGFEPLESVSSHHWGLGIYWYQEVRDSGTNFFFEHLPQGEYNFKYRIRAATAGAFKASPATIQPMYAPEFNAYSAGSVVRIEP